MSMKMGMGTETGTGHYLCSKVALFLGSYYDFVIFVSKDIRSQLEGTSQRVLVFFCVLSSY